jgi:hypothetical protein
MRRLFLFCMFYSGFLTKGQQVFSNDAARYEANFVARTALLDEFIHRFNNDHSSGIRRYYEEHHKPFNKSRAQMIRSLFNYTTEKWDSTMVERFIQRATEPDKPDLLGFLQGNWYAEAEGRFVYNSVEHSIRMILQIQVNPDLSSQWVILAVKPDFELPQGSGAMPVAKHTTHSLYIHPTANETYFSELLRDFADKARLADIFDQDFLRRRHSLAFYQAILSDRLKFVTVRSLKYHYFQVHDWIFTVDNFERDTRNSGWLISSLLPADAGQRSLYEKKLLEQ